MLNLFRNNVWFQAAIITLVALVMWVPAFVHPTPMLVSATDGPLYTLLYHLLGSIPRLASVFAFLLLVIEGVFLNIVLYDTKMIHQYTWLPMLLFVVLMSATPSSLTLTPMLFASLMVILMLRQLMIVSTYLSLPLERVCATSALIGLATLFYTPAISLLIPMLVIMTIFNLYTWRDWMMILLGFLAPFFAVATYYFMCDGLSSWFQHFISGITSWTWSVVWNNWHEVVKSAIMLILILVPLFGFRLGDHMIAYRKNYSVIATLLIGSIAMSLYGTVIPFALQPFAIPFAFLLSSYLYDFKGKKWFGDITLISFLLLMIIL